MKGHEGNSLEGGIGSQGNTGTIQKRRTMIMYPYLFPKIFYSIAAHVAICHIMCVVKICDCMDLQNQLNCLKN